MNGDVCFTCDGSGWLDDSAEPCTPCDGTGWDENAEQDPNADTTGQHHTPHPPR